MADLRSTRVTVQALPCIVAALPPSAAVSAVVKQVHGVTDCAGVDRDRNDVEFQTEVATLLTDSPATEAVFKKKRGRPPRSVISTSAAVAAVAAAAAKRSKVEEEDVCFICFDGGSLVLCDRRDCPKAYHPACVKRDEAFFSRSIRWDCGWHLCNICQRNALFMCYTCPYSLCKGCVKQADILRVRGNKGFCRTCMSTIMLLEKVPQESKELVQVDFDDTTSWEYLFKVYWVLLKEKEALALDELIRATNPWKVAAVENKDTIQLNHKTCNVNASHLSSSYIPVEVNSPNRMKTRKQLQSLDIDSQKSGKVEGIEVSVLTGEPDWASKELLEFVAHMKNGDTAVVSQFDVQALLLDYIKKNNLRDPRRKCQIICDKRLENLFGKESVGHFEMLKLLEYHFKEESRTNGVIRGAAVALSRQAEEGTREGIQIPNRDNKRQSRRKAEDKDRQIKLDSYAAIDVHNINLIYLKRGLFENLMVDSKNHDKVVGCIVRIKISSSDQKQDMHRLVRIIGTTKANEPDTVDDKVENFMLKILNLNKIEDISINEISDQDFSEEECRRLRQCIKLGLVERMTVGEIQDKAMALQATRVSQCLDTEISRLNHLRDRASEMGHLKELRGYVEKIDMLKTPEERHRRASEILEVHADPRMDPSYGSDDDSGESDTNQDGAWTPKIAKGATKGLELIPPKRSGDIYKDDRGRGLNTAAANGHRKRKHSAKPHVGRVEGAPTSLQKTRRSSASKSVEANNRTGSSVIPCSSGEVAIGSFSETSSAPSAAVSQEMLLVSDLSELEKIWHYRDPSGKVQGPFCMLQLRKWDSNGFFPSDLRVWRTNEAYNQSVFLTDALKNPQQSSESYFQQPSCLQSLDGARYDDGKVNSVGGTGSNSCGSSMDKANEEVSYSNMTDIASNPEVNELSVNGHSCQPDFDSQGGRDQSSEQKFKTQLIESLFNIEEPCSDATANMSPEMMDADVKHVSSHPPNAMTNGLMESDTPAMENDPSSSNAVRPESGTSDARACKETEISNLPDTMPNSDKEDMESKPSPSVYEDKGSGGGTRSGVINVSEVPSPLLKTENKDADIGHSTALADHESDAGGCGRISGAKDVSVLPHAGEHEEGETLKPPSTEGSPPIASDIPRGDSGTIRNHVSCGIDASPLASKHLNEGSIVDSKCPAVSSVPKRNLGASWSSVSCGATISELFDAQPDTVGFKIPTSENKDAANPSIPGRDSGISQNSTSGGTGFSNMPTVSINVDSGPSRGLASENNPCPTNVHGQDPSISWGITSSLIGGEHLPDVASEWGMYPSLHDKPTVEEFNFGLISCAPAKLADVSGDHASATTSLSQSTHFSPNHLNFDISGWQIELSTLGDDSVSDLLSEVEAMESLRGMSSPTLRMNLGDDSIDSPGDDCFSPLGALSPNLDPGRNDALSSATDLQFQLQPNHLPHNHKDQPHGAFHGAISRPLCTLSIQGPEVSEVVKSAILPVANHMQPNHSDLPHGTFHGAMSSTSHNLLALGSTVEAKSKSTIPSMPNQVQPNYRDQPDGSCHGVSLPMTVCSVSALAVELEAEVAAIPSAGNNMQHNHKDQSPGVCDKPRRSILSALGLEEEEETKPAIASVSHHNFVSEAPLSSLISSMGPPPPPHKPAPPQASKRQSPPQTSLAAAASKSLPSSSLVAATEIPLLPSDTAKPLSPLPPTVAADTVKPVSPQPPTAAVDTAKSVSTQPSQSAAAAKRPLTSQSPSPSLRLGKTSLSLNRPSISQEEGKVEPTSVSVHKQKVDPLDQRPPQTAATGHSWKQGSETTSNGWESPGQPIAPSSKFSGAGSILGSPNIYWGPSGPVGPSVSPNNHWSTSVVSQGNRASQTSPRFSQTSPRFSHNAGRHPGPQDRSHHHQVVDSGFGKSRSTSWNRQPSVGGGGGSSRPLSHRGQRVCKFYEKGCCKNGASCKYLHP